MSKYLVEFTTCVKEALKSDDFWERLQAHCGASLTKSKASFLRSVENMKEGRGPLNNFVALRWIVNELNYPAAKLFGQYEPTADSQGDAKSDRASYHDRYGPDDVRASVDKALAQFVNRAEIQELAELTPRGKRRPSEILAQFNRITDRTMLTLAVCRQTGRMNAKDILFTNLTHQDPRKWGHLGNGLQFVDRLLGESDRLEIQPEGPGVRTFHWRLVAAYQLAALQLLFSSFRRNAPAYQPSLVGEDKQREWILTSLAKVVQLGGALSGQRASTAMTESSFTQLCWGVVHLQNALTELKSAATVENRVPDFGGLPEKLVSKLRLKEQLYPKGRIRLTFEFPWSEALTRGLGLIEAALKGEVLELTDFAGVGGPLDFLPIWEPQTLLAEFALSLGISELLPKFDAGSDQSPPMDQLFSRTAQTSASPEPGETPGVTMADVALIFNASERRRMNEAERVSSTPFMDDTDGFIFNDMHRVGNDRTLRKLEDVGKNIDELFNKD